MIKIEFAVDIISILNDYHTGRVENMEPSQDKAYENAHAERKTEIGACCVPHQRSSIPDQK
jgi:hypothetical protein